MDFVVAVKSLPNRSVRETAKNRITVLLSTAEEVANPDLVHRDKAYMKKLQGTCFDCSKLNANPPQDVCDTLTLEGYPDRCTNYDEPCDCFDCPTPQPEKTCSCTDGYPAVNTPDIGSGYWVGLQANNYYSTPANGGWLVAVGCETGAIIGAFPVSSGNFGYGSGEILGIPVMVYPAGSVYGSGIVPFAETSFPILGLIPQDGDEIVSSNFTILTSGQPGCPLDPTISGIFCTSGSSGTISIEPQECLSKYGELNIGCDEWDNFKTQPVPQLFTTYYTSVGHIESFDFNASPKVLVFEDSNGSRYCSVVEYERQASDALGGICGGTVWPDQPVAVYDDCVDCVTTNIKVPCQYLNNLTMGSFSINYFGYTAATDLGYHAIGPANPPILDTEFPTGEEAQITNTEFWETWWGWNPQIGYGWREATPWSDGNNRRYVLPPIDLLYQDCECTDGKSSSGGFTFIEQFTFCDQETPVQKTGQTGLHIRRSFAPGLACTSCQPRCTDPKCSCANLQDNLDSSSDNYRHILGPVGDYGYIPCYNFSDDANSTLAFNTSIWWLSQIGGDSSPSNVHRSNSGIITPGPDNSCDTILKMYKKDDEGYLPLHCETPCANILEASDTDENGQPLYTLNLSNLLACTGLNINDPCFKARYLPRDLMDCDLTIKDPPYYDYRLINYVKVNCNGTENLLSNILCNCESGADDCLRNCWLSNIVGPFYTGGKCGPHIISLANCTIPVNKKIETSIFPDCTSPESVKILKLDFEEIRNQKCYEVIDSDLNYSCPNSNLQPSNQLDPCACCKKQISLEYGYYVITCNFDVSDTGTCSDCCQGNGCVDALCDLPTEIILCDTFCSGGTGIIENITEDEDDSLL